MKIRQNIVTHIKSKEEIDEEKLCEAIRERRSVECFPYVNRGRLWYNRLSDNQLSELARWYEAWLNAPETKYIPKKPRWLDSKVNEEDFL
jgi:hypothetical protein